MLLLSFKISLFWVIYSKIYWMSVSTDQNSAIDHSLSCSRNKRTNTEIALSPRAVPGLFHQGQNSEVTYCYPAGLPVIPPHHTKLVLTMFFQMGSEWDGYQKMFSLLKVLEPREVCTMATPFTHSLSPFGRT